MNSKLILKNNNISSNIIKLLVIFQIINFINSEIDKIIRLGDEDFRYVHFSSNLNGDMIVGTSTSSDSSYKSERKFFGLKKNGRFYFKNNSPFLSLYETNNYAKISPQSCFIQISTDDENNEKEYLFSMSISGGSVDIYDFEQESISSAYQLIFYNSKNIQSLVSSIFKSSYQPDSKYYYIFAHTIKSIPDIPIYLIRDYFDSSTVSKIRFENKLSETICTNKKIITCFETIEYRIICLYQNSDYYLEIYIYPQASNTEGTKQTILYEGALEENENIFFKGIHLKEEIGVFMYYTSIDSKTPIVSIKKYIVNTGMEGYNSFNEININKIEDFNSSTTLNDIMKINDSKICIASISSTKEILYLVILSLFENDTKMLISYYSFDMYQSHGFYFYEEIKIYLYNDYISLGFSHCTSCSEDNDIHYSSLIIFNYPNSNDINLNLIEYLSDNNKDIESLDINLTDNIIIENDIFGYSILGIKIIDISENLNIYFKKNKTLILKDYILSKDDNITISIPEISTVNITYIIEYAGIVKEADFNNFITNAKLYDYIKINNINELEDSYISNEYIGRSSYYNIIIEGEVASSGCTVEHCSLCPSNNLEECIACNREYYYSENECILKPEENNNNLSSTILSTQIAAVSIEEDIISVKINTTREELKQYLDELMTIIEIKKNYKIYGNDYNITIDPINTVNNIDLLICEKILRKKYNISPNEILTILQIRIDKNNEMSLTNQVEYAIYNNKRDKLDLSYCEDVRIKVIYDIKNEDLLNKTNIEYYSELGIDIFDIHDSFFNDLCYPYSILNSDIILKDRVLDIYQNYSLCDKGCQYESIDIEGLTIACYCEVKTEISTDISEPVFEEAIKNTFKDSNFGVLRCYNLVFNLNNKSDNIGFFIILFFIICHIICYIIYFISGIKSIVDFVYKEMINNNYIAKVSNPKRKKSSKDTCIFEENKLKRNNIYIPSLKNNKNEKEKFTKRKKKKTIYTFSKASFYFL